MTWTYSMALTGNNDIVRYLVGDVDTTDQLVQDEEIAFAVSQNPNVRLAAAEIADRIALKFARGVTTRVGETQVNYSDRAKPYAALAKQLRLEAGLRSALPYAGGISIADKAGQNAHTDRVAPAFTRQMDDKSWSTWESAL